MFFWHLNLKPRKGLQSHGIHTSTLDLCVMKKELHEPWTRRITIQVFAAGEEPKPESWRTEATSYTWGQHRDQAGRRPQSRNSLSCGTVQNWDGNIHQFIFSEGQEFKLKRSPSSKTPFLAWHSVVFKIFPKVCLGPKLQLPILVSLLKSST